MLQSLFVNINFEKLHKDSNSSEIINKVFGKNKYLIEYKKVIFSDKLASDFQYMHVSCSDSH